MLTRRRACHAATAAAIGMPIPTNSTSTTLSDRSPVKNRSPVKAIVAIAGRSAKKRPKPATTPTTVATLDSTVASLAICRGVAPTRRMAAKRCSRRAAESRVAPPMNTSTGNSSAAATTDKTSVTPFELVPTVGAHSAPQWSGDVVLIWVI